MAALPAESKMVQSFTSPALEVLRRFALTASSTSLVAAEQARDVVRRATETELHMLFRPEYRVSAEASLRALDIVAPLLPSVQRFYTPALDDLGKLGAGPGTRDTLRVHLTSDSYRAEISGLCAVVLAASLLQP